MTFRCISRSVLLISAVAACGGAQVAGTQDDADLVLVGGDVRTMDPAHPHATEVGVRNGKIVAVDHVRRGPNTRVVELHGATVTPGLVDAHCHLHELGQSLESVDLRGSKNEAEAVARVVAAAKQLPDDARVVGRGWDQNLWPDKRFPTKATLDAALPGRVVVLERIDGHAAWVSSRALEESFISDDPPGGRIIRDERGAPSGVLIDNAADHVEKMTSLENAEARERHILAAAQQAIAAGITGIHEMGIDDKTVAAYQDLAARDKLPLRIYAYHAGAATGAPPPPVGNFTLRGVKFFADGALGSRGARLYADYTDDPPNRGLWVTEPKALQSSVLAAVDQGWQVAIHAIGDAGIGSVLDAYTAAVAAHPHDDLRLRVEHLQVLAPADLPRLIATHAIASMQPTHATSDMPWAEARLGPSRILGAYAWRTVLDHHVPLAFGSDFPVEEVGPLLGIYAAVTRQDAAGNPAGGWYPAQRMTLDEAIAAFTRGAAYAEFAETHRGMIRVGFDADLTVFDRPLAADRSLLETHARMTIVGGQIVYQRK